MHIYRLGSSKCNQINQRKTTLTWSYYNSSIKRLKPLLFPGIGHLGILQALLLLQKQDKCRIPSSTKPNLLSRMSHHLKSPLRTPHTHTVLGWACGLQAVGRASFTQRRLSEQPEKPPRRRERDGQESPLPSHTSLLSFRSL